MTYLTTSMTPRYAIVLLLLTSGCASDASESSLASATDSARGDAALSANDTLENSNRQLDDGQASPEDAEVGPAAPAQDTGGDLSIDSGSSEDDVAQVSTDDIIQSDSEEDDATTCPPNRRGDNCAECAGGWTGDDCDSCPENWAGENCDECAGNWAGEDCDICPENWAGQSCEDCAERFTGDECNECADPTFTGDDCSQCANPKFTGENCDECADPIFTGDDCLQCANPKFTGENCDECSDSKFIGESCSECADPKFTGEDCDECADPALGGVHCDDFFRQLWPLSTARSTSNRPVFRVTMVPETLDGARITICEDVACQTELLAFSFEGGGGICPEPVPSGPIYWYAEGLIGQEVVTDKTPVWQLHIPAYPAPHATAWGSTFDLELDGYADVLVGGCGLSGCTEIVGLHRGGPEGPSPVPDYLITDPQQSASFGFSVSTAGDVNGDGLPDIIVGAGLGDSAHVFLNSPDGVLPEPAQSWVVPGAWFGFSVASAGDVNGDGYGDVIIGSMLGFSAFIYYGSPDGPSAGPDVALSTGAFGFGVSVSSAGDVNGDGYEDLICGAANGMPPEVSVWLGGPDGPPSAASQVLTGDGTYGISARGAGDLNRDGYSDIVIGNPDPNSQLFVAHYGGPAGLSAEPSFTTTGPQNFGLSVAGAGDVNGDGYGDVVISAKDKALVYHGSADGLIEQPAMTLQGPSGSQFGDSVAALGDTNRDGYDDLGVGATNNAEAYTYWGSGEGINEQADIIMTPQSPSDGYGFSVGHSVR